MNESIGALSLLPPAVAIVLAFATRRVLVSLLFGVLAGVAVLNLSRAWLTPFAALDYMSRVAADLGNLQLIAFSLLVGGLLHLIRASHGFTAFAQAVERLRGGYGKGTVYGLTYGVGVSMFLECWSNLLVNGATVGTLYDRLGISRERMAYFVHTIGLNVVAVVVLNGWGAFYMGLLSAQAVEQPFQLIVQAMPYNIYSWASHAVVILTMATGLSLGAMKRVEAARAAAGQVASRTATSGDVGPAGPQGPGFRPKVAYMLAPLVVLIGTMVVSLYLTGGGDISRGEGTASILYAVVLAIAVLAIQLRIDRIFTFVEIEEKTLAGMREFFDVAILIVLALSLGQLCRDMGTGLYISQMIQDSLPVFIVPALIFLLGALMSFATGTSYGTLAVMMPIVLPLSEVSGLGAALLFGACLSGAVFGDNTSPISDTTIVTSLATEVSVVDHVRTQLPYALLAAGLALAAFLVIGVVAS